MRKQHLVMTLCNSPELYGACTPKYLNNHWTKCDKVLRIIHGPKRINPIDFGDPLTLHFAPPSGQNQIPAKLMDQSQLFLV